MRTRSRTAHGAALLYVLGAGAALACPTAADLDGPGIRFTTSDGFAEVQRRIDADRIEVSFHTPDVAEIHRVILIHGTYLHWFGTYDAEGGLLSGSTGWITRDGGTAALPVPEADQRWSMAQTFTLDSGETVEERISTDVGSEFTWVLGECRYTALPVTLTISGPDESYSDEVTYLPDLGTGVLTGYQNADGAGSYGFVDIAVEPER